MMNNSESKVLSNSKFVSVLIGAMVGMGILVLPIDAVKSAHQDGWISTILGGVYPLYIIGMATYIAKEYPDNDILFITKKNFGKFLGVVLNFIFLTFCIFLGSNVVCGYSNLMRGYAVGWLTPFKLIAMFTFIIAFTSYQGLQPLAKVCEIAVVITVIFALSPIQTLKLASLLNIKPIFGSGIKAILGGITSTLFSYSGIELVFLYYSCVKEKKKIKWYSLLSVVFAMVLYGWICFVSTLYLGPDIVLKSQWPFVLATQSVTISIINNYSYLFILMWSIIAIKCAAIYYYTSIKILKDIVPKFESRYICIMLYPIFVYSAIKLGNEISRRSIVGKLVQMYTIFNFIYITVNAVLIFFKKKKK